MAARAPRVTGGDLRGRVLTVIPRRTADLRPTAARVREAIFSIIGAMVDGATVLDLYAGTGLMGIEALSRGAARATFIEASQERCRALNRNLAELSLDGRGTVIAAKLPGALGTYAGLASLVFLDPPYADPTADETLARLRPVLTADATVVYEHSSRYNPPEHTGGLAVAARRTYGDSAIALYHIAENE